MARTPRTRWLTLALAPLVLLLVAAQDSCTPTEVGERGLFEMVLDVKGTILELQAAVCKLYVLTGNEEALPGFCPREPSLCELPIDPGPCRGSFPRFGFDADSGRCEPFTYGGCQGNDNNFQSLAACERRCGPPPPVCEQPIDPGPCEAAIPRFGFDAEAGRCARFIYGGCQGNDNNFTSLGECEQSCGEPMPVCEQPPEVGDCDAAIPRWFHNAGSGNCERFVWGGCGGNENNFETLAACENACVSDDVCTLPADPGICLAAILRWHHDPATGRCERFVWGGCGGNGNNFETLAQCERACPLCDESMCGEHQECRLWNDPDCSDAAGCPTQPFCADLCTPDRCPAGSTCRLIETPCFGPPCAPVAICEPNDPCALVRCQANQECRVFEATGEAFCADTCEGFECPDGSQCVIQPVQCVRAPCPGVAACVGFSSGG